MTIEQREAIMETIRGLQQELLLPQSDQHREIVEKRIEWWWAKIWN